MKSKFFKNAAYRILPFIINLVQKTLFITCKKVYHLPKDNIVSPTIWVCWHGQLLMVHYIYRKIKPPSSRIHVVVSQHIHGDMAISVAKKLGVNFIRGSSREGAMRALKGAMDILNSGEDIGITPDGPRGPAYNVSDGVVTLSTKYNVSIVALGWSTNSFWQLKSWDKTKIPKPFSTITLKASEPFKLDGLTKDEAKNMVHQKIMECMDR